MNSTIPGNTMNTNYIICCSFQFQFNAVFIGKFNVVICQNLFGENKLTKTDQFSSVNLWNWWRVKINKILRLKENYLKKKLQLSKLSLKMIQNCGNTQNPLSDHLKKNIYLTLTHLLKYIPDSLNYKAVIDIYE